MLNPCTSTLLKMSDSLGQGYPSQRLNNAFRIISRKPSEQTSWANFQGGTLNVFGEKQESDLSSVHPFVYNNRTISDIPGVLKVLIAIHPEFQKELRRRSIEKPL